MNRIIHVSLLILVAAGIAAATELDGMQIMRRVDSRPESDGIRQLMTVVMTDARGGQRERSLLMFNASIDGEDRSLVVFTAPADVRDVGPLTIDVPGQPSGQWLWMPAVGRTRRIASSAKDDSFLGTDFFFEDLEGRAPEDDVHEFLREETILGFACWVVESIPVRDSVYSRRVSWIDQESLLPIRVEFYDRRGELWKVMETLRVEFDGSYAVAVETVMRDIRRSRSTTIIADEVDHGFEPSDSFFTVATLERGVR